MRKVLLNRRRREVHTIATQPCYTAFFVGNLPPNGFRANYANIRYICQQLPGDLKPIKTTYYSSMFDVSYGITIFSAYVVKAADASKIGTSSRQGLKWRTEPGNCSSLSPFCVVIMVRMLHKLWYIFKNGLLYFGFYIRYWKNTSNNEK